MEFQDSFQKGLSSGSFDFQAEEGQVQMFSNIEVWSMGQAQEGHLAMHGQAWRSQSGVIGQEENSVVA